MKRIAINGFGRIGRSFLRILAQDPSLESRIEVVAINIGPSEVSHTAHLFKYDTLMGTFPGTVTIESDYLIVNNKRIKLLSHTDPKDCGWKSLDIDWVVDCSGKFTKKSDAVKHIDSGARAVLISAPAYGADITIIPGVNQHDFDAKKHKIVSLGSCTTNAVVPMLWVIEQLCGIKYGAMTTVHAYTSSQHLLDGDGKDLRRARAAALNIVPTSTGASRVMGEIIPAIAGKISSLSLRVPVGKGSLIDLSLVVKDKVDKDRINQEFRSYSQTSLRSIMMVSEDPLVSSDCNGTPYSVIIDSMLTDTVEDVVKVFGWYDNEWGYSHRLKDFLLID